MQLWQGQRSAQVFPLSLQYPEVNGNPTGPQQGCENFRAKLLKKL
jgi:hypothetical protein